MKQVFIHSVGSISAQKTFDNSSFLDEIVSHETTTLPTVNPPYKEFIPPAAARRMARGIKMGVVASKIAMQEAGLENVDAIITGTGMGCMIESEKFVSSLIDNDEEYLTPTPFIQSTHNTVGGQIALGLQCKGYNFTYVNSAVSFESALLDAQLQLQNDEAETILVGGVDELGEYSIELHKLIKHIKTTPEDNVKLLQSTSKGAIFGEGANFFVLSNKTSESAYAELLSVTFFNTLPKEKLAEKATEFLKENSLSPSDVSLLILGNNGDVEFDDYYNNLGQNTSFSETPQLYYKHLCGEFKTASSFGFWVAANILKRKQVPEILQLNSKSVLQPKIILLYNQYRGKNHSFTLLKNVEV